MDAERGDLTGRVIASQFRVERKLGEGGMGAVYLAEQLEMGRKVVLKVMRPHLLGSAAAPVIEERFKREARIVAHLNHPNIVQVHVFGRTDDGQLYLAMEYIEGRSLRELLSMRGALPEARALRIVDQLCSALIEAHDLGLVHRDLKPDNIMLTDRHGNPDYVKVLDFGIAKMREAPDARLTQTGAIFGTPAYISPEQARALPVDRRTDLYALGVILYEMLSGQLPFVAESAVDYLLKHVGAPVQLLSTRFPEIAILPRTDAMVARALQKEPEKRFQSAAELQREVRHALADRPDAAKPFPTPASPLDETTSSPPSPTGPAPRTFGEETAEDAKACRASRGRFVGARPSRSPGCEGAEVGEVAMAAARLILHHECYDDALCRMHVSQDFSSELDAVTQFRTSRKAMLAWLGPPDQHTTPCSGYAVEHLVDSLRDGHCEVSVSWQKENAGITLNIRPTDPMIAGPVMYPIKQWTVTASFLTPEYEKTRRSVPPL